MPILISRQIKTPEEKAAFVEKYLDGVNFDVNEDYLEYVSGRYPESKEDIKARAAFFSSERVTAYSKPGKRVFHLVVSHGTPIRMFSRHFGGREKKIKYSGLSAVAITAP